MHPELSNMLYGKTLPQIQEIAAALGAPKFAAAQLCSWLYAKHAQDFDVMSNLAKPLRSALAADWTIGGAAPLKETASKDGTKKYLFESAGGACVESAMIPDADRATLCLSTQAGCRMGCTFCMTGRQGAGADLSSGAILNQYRMLPERDAITNIVYMGMGEPFDNTDAVLDSLEVFTAPWGYAKSPSRITVSTIGVIPGMQRFLERSRCHIALSLHSPFEEERQRIIPASKKYPIRDIMQVLRKHNFYGQRRLTFEYIVFQGVNHTKEHALELARLIGQTPIRINLISWHAIPDTPLKPASYREIEIFQNILKGMDLQVTLRKSRGEDIAAACGLLHTGNTAH